MRKITETPFALKPKYITSHKRGFPKEQRSVALISYIPTEMANSYFLMQIHFLTNLI